MVVCSGRPNKAESFAKMFAQLKFRWRRSAGVFETTESPIAQPAASARQSFARCAALAFCGRPWLVYRSITGDVRLAQPNERFGPRWNDSARHFKFQISI